MERSSWLCNNRASLSSLAREIAEVTRDGMTGQAEQRDKSASERIERPTGSRSRTYAMRPASRSRSSVQRGGPPLLVRAKQLQLPSPPQSTARGVSRSGSAAAVRQGLVLLAHIGTHLETPLPQLLVSWKKMRTGYPSSMYGLMGLDRPSRLRLWSDMPEGTSNLLRRKLERVVMAEDGAVLSRSGQSPRGAGSLPGAINSAGSVGVS